MELDKSTCVTIIDPPGKKQLKNLKAPEIHWVLTLLKVFFFFFFLLAKISHQGYPWSSSGGQIQLVYI